MNCIGQTMTDNDVWCQATSHQMLTSSITTTTITYAQCHIQKLQKFQPATDQVLDNGSSSKYFYVQVPETEQRHGFPTTGSIQHPPSRRRSQWVCSTGTECCCTAGLRQLHADAGARMQSHSSHSQRSRCPTNQQSRRVDAVHQMQVLAVMTVHSPDTEAHNTVHSH